MIKKGDLVKVIGKTINGRCEAEEMIPIGTICKVVDVDENDGTVEIIPFFSRAYYSCGYWYLPKDLQKGRFEWIPESEVD